MVVKHTFVSMFDVNLRAENMSFVWHSAVSIAMCSASRDSKKEVDIGGLWYSDDVAGTLEGNQKSRQPRERRMAGLG